MLDTLRSQYMSQMMMQKEIHVGTATNLEDYFNIQKFKLRQPGRNRQTYYGRFDYGFFSRQTEMHVWLIFPLLFQLHFLLNSFISPNPAGADFR